MGLRLDDRWIWDFWLADDGERHHLFYLQAPRSIGDPHLRHWNVSIGHAVSDDLTRWEVIADALAPGPPGAWDDAATWTGSVGRHDGTWWMFYTGATSGDDALVRRIGAATSDDLVTWRRHDRNPLVEVAQSAVVQGRPLLLFSVDRAHVWDVRKAALSAGLEAGTHVAPGAGPHEWAMLGFANETDDGFVGEISDPFPFDAATLLPST